ncbi:hypothetical protein ABEB36_003814 [Hypothenemus hampei]|uniref:Dicer-2 n=1 Tax=Hypothenemus hampei TaxID=57062 RepID=A0ABD1F2I6_HYPHA
MALDFWPKTKWYEEFDKYDVFVMTIQILVNLANQDFLDLNKVNLIVFDECHRGVSDQPMRQLCKSLELVENKPRILGLTATLLNGNCTPNRIHMQIRELEITYHSKVATVDGLEQVIGYSTNPKELVLSYMKYNCSSIDLTVIKILTDAIEVLNEVKNTNMLPTNIKLENNNLKPLNKDEGLKKLINSIKDVIIHISELGIYGGYKAILAHIIQVERLKKHCSDSALNHILSYVQTAYCQTQMLFKTEMQNYENIEKIFQFSSDKVLKLIGIFVEYSKLSKEPLCSLIFTKRRFTAKVIYYILKSLSESAEYSHIKPNFIVSCNNNPYNDTREALYRSKKNKEIIQAFENKEINVLCASNVLEEGVDISTCSLVVKFDSPEEYRSYIQSKGRARNPASLFYMMVEDTKIQKFKQRYSEFQEVELTLQKLLIGQNDLRSEPSDEEITRMYNEDPIPPYYVDGKNSARVDLVSAISLLCQYCNSLPCDKYTDLAPELYKEERENADIRVIILMPTICPLTEPIIGPYMPCLKLAKRAAALSACIKLYEIGELDKHLLPKKQVIPEDDVSFLFKHYPSEKEPTAGTNKNKRKHKKKIPLFLQGQISSKISVWLHIIDLQPVFERRQNINYSSLYDMYTSNLTYGIITPNSVPTISDFPIYASLGAINVQLKVNLSKIELDEKTIRNIRAFNILVYNDILVVLREFLMFDNETDAESMLIVPVNKELGIIDIGILEEHQTVREPWREPTSEEKLSLIVTQENYLKKIVSPWYRDMGNFLVTEVALMKTAQSPFPNEQFSTFADYYHEKHNVSILNPAQPLLLVRGLSKKLNFIKPEGLQKKRKKETLDEFEIHLIPELVVKQDFPADLWIQAHFLPTILSRISYMFRLEEFRLKISSEMGLKCDLNGCEQKKPLELDEYLLDYIPNTEKEKPVNVLVSAPKEDVIMPQINKFNVNKDYAKKMLEQEYPWQDSEEPKDIERDLNVTVLDVMYYEHFVSKQVTEEEYSLKNEMPRTKKDQLALTYFKDYEEKPIELIETPFNFQSGPDLPLIYKAMTTSKANDIVNMERLETLGDSFLKLFSSIYIFLKFPHFTEGIATTLKSRLVSNKNLFYLGSKKNIGGIMKINDLQMPDWLPPGFKIPDQMEMKISNKETTLSSLYRIDIPLDERISGQLSTDTIGKIMDLFCEEDSSEEGLIQELALFFKCNYVGDKKIADCVEALLGAYFQTCGIGGAIKFIEWIGLIPKSENVSQLFSQPAKDPILNPKATLADINYHLPDWEKIENDILGYHFKNRGYLLQALTHASYTPNHITQSYEKLEFLGDAILDFLITCHIYEACGNLDPGDLTDLRSALVNNNTFASLVVRNNLHKYLLMFNGKLQSMIDRFSTYIESKKFQIDDEVLILLEESDAEGLNLAEYVDVPKVLGDVFESLAGAIFLDCGKDLKVVWKVFHRLMWKEIENFSAKIPRNLVRKLYEWNPNPHPKFGNPVEAGATKVMVPLQFMLNGRPKQVYGVGSNKVMAKKAAAKLALRQLC